MAIEIEVKPKKRLKIRRIRKELFKNSPITRKMINYGVETFGRVGAFYGVMTLSNMCMIVTPTKLVYGKFGESGIGKTLPEKVAIESLKGIAKFNLWDLSRSKGVTPAGLVKLYRKCTGDDAKEKDMMEWSKIVESDMVYLEDLAFLRTRYTRETTTIILHALPSDSKLSDLTSSGEPISEMSLGKTKRVLFAGTPDVYDEITSMLTYDEFMNRRCLYLMCWLSPREWSERESHALKQFYMNSEREHNITNDWIRMAKHGLRIPNLKKHKIKFSVEDKKAIDRERKLIYKEMIKFKRIPESALEKIDALAIGHALINNRITVLLEDYEFISLLLWRYVVTSVMRRQELAIFNELCRRDGKGCKVRDIADYLRIRSKSEGIPEIAVSIQTIKKYGEVSKFMDIVYDSERNAMIVFTDETKRLIKLFERVVKRLRLLAKNRK